MKPYVKPQLFFESYELNQHIAACRWDMTLNEGNTECHGVYDVDLGNTLYDNDLKLFAATADGCTITDIESYCYHNGAQDDRIYQS